MARPFTPSEAKYGAAEEEAAITIQSGQRGKVARNNVKELRQFALERENQLAAEKFQAELAAAEKLMQQRAAEVEAAIAEEEAKLRLMAPSPRSAAANSWAQQQDCAEQLEAQQ
ncbi:hypothetical protein CYMTET_47601 [Cymbomonas tetramitiformis]|uniref:Uncharacterized protein n=1 Tax=Cymbomonas tetramitiformis TaxID=36881 RepID=A0AAE0BVT3_9CHLO|nr:hypothetical protein CYMTET_47601 [Cymbomonas tetramitiformis]